MRRTRRCRRPARAGTRHPHSGTAAPTRAAAAANDPCRRAVVRDRSLRVRRGYAAARQPRRRDAIDCIAQTRAQIARDDPSHFRVRRAHCDQHRIAGLAPHVPCARRPQRWLEACRRAFGRRRDVRHTRRGSPTVGFERLPGDSSSAYRSPRTTARFVARRNAQHARIDPRPGARRKPAVHVGFWVRNTTDIGGRKRHRSQLDLMHQHRAQRVLGIPCAGRKRTSCCRCIDDAFHPPSVRCGLP